MSTGIEGRSEVRVRFAPSPTGYLHVGGARTALFNYLLARKHGGSFILRIEDTDRARHVEDSVSKIPDDLRWLGLNWDEGPEAGGEVGPYYQSQRLDLYKKYTDDLLASGDAYFALETPEELAAMREAARKASGGFQYPRPDPLPTVEQGLAARRQGRPAVVRFKMPGTDITVVDAVLGDVTMPAGELEDFVIQKGDGFPTYHFACVVDDELMRISHVLRGQEHLMNTPKHVALQRALHFATPVYAHLPVIFNVSGSKMSKRDKEAALKRGEVPPEIEVHDFRQAGYFPEALLNFLALLGWNPGDDREYFTLEELADVFSLDRIGRTNARFDRDKLLAFNTEWSARVGCDRVVAAWKDYWFANGRELPVYQRTGEPVDDDTLGALVRCCAGFRTLRQLDEKTRFLFIPDEDIAFDPKAVRKVLEKGDGAGYEMLAVLLPRLEALPALEAATIETMLADVCQEHDVKLGKAAQPLRVAITGSTVSPPIYESLALLGKERVCARIRRCLEARCHGAV